MSSIPSRMAKDGSNLAFNVFSNLKIFNVIENFQLYFQLLQDMLGRSLKKIKN